MVVYEGQLAGLGREGVKGKERKGELRLRGSRKEHYR